MQSSEASEEMSKEGSVFQSLVMSEVIMLFHRDSARFVGVNRYV